MGGWKTKTGGIIVALSQIVPVLGIGDFTEPVSQTLVGIGGLLSVWGIGHKVERKYAN